MQEFIRFLSQGWIGTIAGIAGLTLAVFFHLRSRKSSIIAIQSKDVSMIGGGAVFPDEVEVRYRGTPVPRLTSSIVWIWNAGNKTVKGSEIVAHDPLRLRFGGEILAVRIRKVTREVLRITANTSEEEEMGMVCWDFEFLDPGDGGVLEVLHSGSTEAPKSTGTIIGLPKGPQYLGTAWGVHDSSKREQKRRKLFMWLLPACPLFFYLGMILGEITSRDLTNASLPPSWLIWVLGLWCVSLSALLALRMWKIRRQIPSSLVVYKNEKENESPSSLDR